MKLSPYKCATLRQACTQELLSLKRYATHFILNGFEHRNVLFYPERPDPRASICGILHALGYNIIHNPRKRFELAVHWAERTVKSRPDAVLLKAAERAPVINLHCLNTRKDHIEAVFREVFGYATFVDPLTHRGKCVRKSAYTGKRDARVVECPLERVEPGFVYQRLLSRIDRQQRVVDYRLAIYGDSIAYMTLRYKRPDHRFDQTFLEIPVDPREFLSDGEIAQILRCCRMLQMDYGEMDFIRDQKDDRLYLLDANSTPLRPAYDRQITPGQRVMMLRNALEAFEEHLLPVVRSRPASVPAGLRETAETPLLPRLEAAEAPTFDGIPALDHESRLAAARNRRSGGKLPQPAEPVRQ